MFQLGCVIESVLQSQCVVVLDLLTQEERALMEELVALLKEEKQPTERPNIAMVLRHPLFTRCSRSRLPAFERCVDKFAQHVAQERDFFDVISLMNWAKIRAMEPNRRLHSYKPGYVKRWLEPTTDRLVGEELRGGEDDPFFDIFEEVAPSTIGSIISCTLFKEFHH